MDVIDRDMVDNARDILLQIKNGTNISKVQEAGKVNFSRGGSSKSKKSSILSRMQGGTGTQQAKSVLEKKTKSHPVEADAVKEARAVKERSGTSDPVSEREASPDMKNGQAKEIAAIASDRYAYWLKFWSKLRDPI